MKRSRRARRMAKSHRRSQTVGRLNLVSLMDIFTILVFFLMVNSSDVEVLPADRRIKLPDSISTQQPGAGVLLAVGADFLSVDGRRVIDLNALDMADSGTALPALVTELRNHSDAGRPRQAVTVMGDREIPYRLLKRILVSCAEASFVDVALAVNGQQTATMPDDQTL